MSQELLLEYNDTLVTGYPAVLLILNSSGPQSFLADDADWGLCCCGVMKEEAKNKFKNRYVVVTTRKFFFIKRVLM
jgi:hypothetical protein